MLLGYFTEEAYNTFSMISNVIPKITPLQMSGFLHISEAMTNSKMSSVDVSVFVRIILREKRRCTKVVEDSVNTRSIYDAFKSLTPLQASNKYLWTHPRHAEPAQRFI